MKQFSHKCTAKSLPVTKPSILLTFSLHGQVDAQRLAKLMAFFLLCSLVSSIFTMFFRDSEVCQERCNSYVDFGYLTKKSKNFLLRYISKRTHCPSSVNLALLLFVSRI